MLETCRSSLLQGAQSPILRLMLALSTDVMMMMMMMMLPLFRGVGGSYVVVVMRSKVF